MRLTQQEHRDEPGQIISHSSQSNIESAFESAFESRPARFWRWLKDDAGAVAIEYVIVAIALLAIAGAIAAALTTLGDDAVEKIPGSISEVGG